MISARLTTAGIRDGRKLMPSGKLSHKSEEETMKLAAYTIAASFVGFPAPGRRHDRRRHADQ
jgi:hypothetical protein